MEFSTFVASLNLNSAIQCVCKALWIMMYHKRLITLEMIETDSHTLVISALWPWPGKLQQFSRISFLLMVMHRRTTFGYKRFNGYNRATRRRHKEEMSNIWGYCKGGQLWLESKHPDNKIHSSQNTRLQRIVLLKSCWSKRKNKHKPKLPQGSIKYIPQMEVLPFGVTSLGLHHC